MMHPVIATTNCEKNCDIIACRFLRILQKFFKGNVDFNQHYWCFKFERNYNIRKLFLSDLNIFVVLCEEICEENRAIFRNKYLKKH